MCTKEWHWILIKILLKIELFSIYCFAINNTRFLDIAFKDVIKDVTESESKHLNFSKTLHQSPPSSTFALGSGPNRFLILFYHFFNFRVKPLMVLQSQYFQ